MRLYIQHAPEKLDINFGYWLIERIKLKLISNINLSKMSLLDNYLSQSKDIKRLYNKKYTACEIIMFATNNLICFKGADDIVITFDNNKFVPGFDRLNLITAIKLIDYGNRDVKGCHIFRDTFDYFAKDIDKYVKLYFIKNGV